MIARILCTHTEAIQKASGRSMGVRDGQQPTESRGEVSKGDPPVVHVSPRQEWQKVCATDGCHTLPVDRRTHSSRTRAPTKEMHILHTAPEVEVLCAVLGVEELSVELPAGGAALLLWFA